MFYLNDDEYIALKNKVNKTSFSRESFIRAAIKGTQIKEAPPIEYYELIRELRRIGSNLNQLLKIANTKGLLDAPRLRKELDANRELENRLWRLFQNGES